MRSFRPYLELIRVFLTPTAVADSFTGLALAAALAGIEPSAGRILLACGASVALYWLGMAANDLFDRAKDAAAAPARPIPSGRVSPLEARVLCAVLAGSGLLCAWLAEALPVAAALLATITLYDAGAKRIPWIGPILMGLCRSQNFLLGAAAAVGASRAVATPPLLAGAAILGLYIAGVTAASELEEAPFDPARLLRRAVPVLLVPLILISIRITSALSWLNGIALAAIVSLALSASTRTGAGSPIHGAAIFVRTALGGIYLVDAGVVLGLFPPGVSPLRAFLTLYGLFALGWLWKRRWLRAGSSGS